MSGSSDHRAVQTPVRDQGNRGACVGFAVAAAHEWMRLGAIRSVEDVLWAAHTQGGDPAVETTTVQRALAGVQAHRHAEETAWPFNSPPFPAARPIDAARLERQVDLVAWRRLAAVDAEAVALEVAQGNAVVLTLGVVVGAWPMSGDVDAPAGRTTPRGHAVLAVGSDGTSNGRTLIKNSWGVGWGVAGYGFVSARYLGEYHRAGHVLEVAT